jgi:nitrate reductase gamma subunit
MHGTAIEGLFAAGYALFLAATAAVLELIARHSHRRAQAIQTTGFTYDRKFDHWICPVGQPLHRIETVWERKVARYRAQAHHCNNCAIKHHCTDSDEGRVIEHQVDSWLQSGLRQFHRGISLMLLFLAFLISVIEILRQSGIEQASLGTLAAVIGAACLKLAATIRVTT